MGVTPSWIRSAITEGVPVGGRLVKLEAEILAVSRRRRMIRIHLDRFVVFLIAIGWRRLPTIPRDPRLQGG